MIVTINQANRTQTTKGTDCMECTGTSNGKEVKFFVNTRMQEWWDKLQGATLDVGVQKFGQQFWANSIQETDGTSPPPKTNAVKPTASAVKYTRDDNSIETQVAFKGIIELAVAKLLDMKSPEVQAAINWAVSDTRLGKWMPLGRDPIPGADEDTEKPTTEQRKRLSTLLKKWKAEDAKAVLVDRWQTNDSKALTKGQMEDFLGYLADNKPPITPEEVPF